MSQDKNPYLAVTVGSEVKTSDEKRVGTVSEIRGRYFKIKRPWWQRDFWLRTDCVRSSDQGQTIVLNVDQANLENSKIVDGPPVE